MARARTAFRYERLLILAAVGIAVPAGSQIYDLQPGDSRAGGNGTTPENGTTAQRVGSSSTQSQDVAMDQIQASQRQQPYTPDQIESDDRTSMSDRDILNATSRRQDPQLRSRNPQIMKKAPPSEFETFVSDVADRPLRRFGADLLVPEARDFTTPPETSVPLDYRMNPGDVLILGITGSVQADNVKLTINSEGNVFIPRVGPVHVGGLRYADLQSAVSAQIARQYRSFQLSISVDRLHGITVYVTGFANTPGSYTVSSLSTLVNAVFASGGPSAGGSFRSIQLRRDGKLVSDFDLYDLLLKGDKSSDAMLQNGDVIFIAPVGAQVAVFGSTNNEAIFEARPGDSLADVLRYAGGVSTSADLGRLMALDPLNLEAGWQQMTAQEANAQIAKRAQIIRVLTNLGIARPLARQNALVTISGEVARPGRYFLAPGTPMSEAIAQAGGLTSDAYVFGTVFTRESLRLQERKSYDRAVGDVEYMLTIAPLTSSLSKDIDINRATQLRSVVGQLRTRKPDGRFILDVAPDTPELSANVTLENNDTIYVPPVAKTVGVFGTVPGAGSFQYRPGLTIKDYLREAGGVQKLGDRRQTFVVRANGKLVVGKHGMFGSSILGAKALPGDLIYVPINPSRGEFWAKLSTLTSTLFTGAVTTAAVVAATK